MASLVVAVIGAGSALLGAEIGAQATEQSVLNQAREERAKESRERRSATYASYLTAAGLYWNEVWFLAIYLEATHSAASKFPKAIHQPDFAKFRTARTTFQKESSQVFVYGSDEAWSVAAAMASSMPSIADEPQLWTVAQQREFVKKAAENLRKFLESYGSFQRLFCREASATPRLGCK